MPGSVGLTRRGRALLGLLVVLAAVAVRYGTESLNAVLVPGVLALVAAYWQVARNEAPRVERVLPEGDVQGTTAPAVVSFTGDGRTLGVATDAVESEGLSATGNERQAVYADRGFEYDLHYERRGVHAVGPTTFELRDVLGLLRRPVTYDNEETLAVYPRVRPLPRSVRIALTAFEGLVDPNQREEFDRLREYERGDALRDVHWKTSARQPDDDLVVKEFAGSGDGTDGAVTVAVEAETGDGADDAAVAAASVADHLLSEGVAVGLVTPDRSHDPDAGLGQRTAVLEALARLGTDSLPEGARHRADVVVLGSADGATVVVEDRVHPFHVGDVPTAEAEP